MYSISSSIVWMTCSSNISSTRHQLFTYIMMGWISENDIDMLQPLHSKLYQHWLPSFHHHITHRREKVVPLLLDDDFSSSNLLFSSTLRLGSSTNFFDFFLIIIVIIITREDIWLNNKINEYEYC